MIANKIDFRT